MLGGESDKMAVDRPAGSAIVKGLMIAECSGAFFLGAKPRDIRNVFPAVEWSSSAVADVHGVCLDARGGSEHDHCVYCQSKAQIMP